MDDLMASEVNKNDGSPAASMFRLHLRQRRRSDPGNLRYIHCTARLTSRRWQDRFRENSDDSEDDYMHSIRQRDNSPKRKFNNRDRNAYRDNDNRYSENNYRGHDLRNNDRNNGGHNNRNTDIRNSGTRNNQDNRYNDRNNRNDTRYTPNNERGRQHDKGNNFQVVQNRGTPKNSIVADQAFRENTVKRWDDDEPENDMQTNIQTHRRNDNRDDNNNRKRSRSEPGRFNDNKKHRK